MCHRRPPRWVCGVRQPSGFRLDADCRNHLGQLAGHDLGASAQASSPLMRRALLHWSPWRVDDERVTYLCLRSPSSAKSGAYTFMTTILVLLSMVAMNIFVVSAHIHAFARRTVQKIMHESHLVRTSSRHIQSGRPSRILQPGSTGHHILDIRGSTGRSKKCFR